MFLVLAVRVYEPLFDIAGQVEPVPQVAASLARIHALLDAPCEPGARRHPADRGLDLALEAVDFSYGAAPVLVDVGFAVPARTMTAIVGPSGAGKSTILGLWPVSTGRERDRYVSAGSTCGRCPRPTCTTQSASCSRTPTSSGATSATTSPQAGPTHPITSWWRRPGPPAATMTSAPVAGYDTSVGEAGQTPSGGERQRVTLARALLKRAPVLLLDEVTAAVDPSTERVVTEALDRLRATTPIVVVPHRLATVRSADQIVVLEGGRVVGRGTHDELVAAGGLYARWVSNRERVVGWRLASTSR